MTREILLNHGKFALIDNSDWYTLIEWDWRYISAGYGYAIREEGDKIIYMHRQIMNAPEGMEVDHINGIGLDCRRQNLRLTTTPQNSKNKHKHHKSISQYKGVELIKSTGQWRAAITCDYKRYVIGTYENEIEAARAYDAKALELHGEFARTNF